MQEQVQLLLLFNCQTATLSIVVSFDITGAEFIAVTGFKALLVPVLDITIQVHELEAKDRRKSVASDSTYSTATVVCVLLHRNQAGYQVCIYSRQH